MNSHRTTTPVFPPGLIVKDIPGYPGYKADSEGHIWGIQGYRLKWQYCKRGYPRVTIARNTKRDIHILVCLAFHGPRPPGLEIRHLDNNKDNPRPDNLKYGTSRENADDTVRAGLIRGSKNPHSKLTESDVVEMRKLYSAGKMNQTQLAQKHGVSQACIFFALEGIRVWKHVPYPCKMRAHKYHRGSKANRAKLDDDKVIVIKQRIKNGESNIEIAKDYDVTPTAIWHIRHRYTYTHIP